MKLLLPIFLLIVMVTSTSISVVKQCKTATAYELKGSKGENDSTDETDEEEKENKSETEKDLFAYKNQSPIYSEHLISFIALLHIPVIDEDLRSSLYALIPDNPPEA